MISLEEMRSMAEVESVLAHQLGEIPGLCESDFAGPPPALPPSAADEAWIKFEAEVRRANASASSKIRQHFGERCVELLRLLEIEEQTRCQAFQATLMGEVRPAVYIGTVRSILEKLLKKLESFSAEPTLYQGAAQCLSEYMSSLGHHSDICYVPRSPGAAALPAIEEGRDYCDLSSDLVSERSEDTDTSEQTTTMGDVVLAHNGSSEFGGTGITLEDIRKERRRESNKKAASKYRSKKTVSMQQLSGEMAQLRQQMANISSQNAVLSAENKLLKQQVCFLQGMLTSNGGAVTSIGYDCAAPAATHDNMVEDDNMCVHAFPEPGGELHFTFGAS
ncbi:hypothetical protein AB1Y20_001664 [Prymnesium parvum]|uniref:BZIP domain-containing protein n=1 Tax=Prymnesium parvum TaxID=97485 RepID=A0AB34K8Y7_PRYPA